MITTKFKNLFLDRAHVIKKIGEARAKVLMRSGGKVRITAQRSMRYRVKGSSPPGQPPYAHKKYGALLRKLLFFVYDFSADSVVVGPVAARAAEAPKLNEFGGRAKRTRKGGTRIVTYPPRPYMAPALSKIEPSLPKEWANSVVGP